MLTLITPPTVEPLSLIETKAHLRVDISDDDTYISALITAARDYVENVARRAMINQTWELTLDEWPEGNTIRLPKPPLVSVTSVTYTPEGGTATLLSASSYLVDTAALPGQIVLKDDYSWPTDDLLETGAIKVRYVAGYGTAGSSVPEMLRVAMRLLIGNWYENREGGGQADTRTVDLLLMPYRVWA